MKKLIDGFNYYIHEDGKVENIVTGLILKPSINPDNGYLYVSLWKDNKGYTKSVHRLVAIAFIDNPSDKPFINHIDADRTNPNKSNLEWCTQSENIQHAYNICTMYRNKKIQDFEMEMALNSILNGETQTAVSNIFDISEGVFSVRLNKLAKNLDTYSALEEERKRQKRLRNIRANKAKERPVCQYDKEGNFITEYASFSQAARNVDNVRSGAISNCIAGRTKTAGGFIWKLP